MQWPRRGRRSICRRATITALYVLAASADGDQQATFEVGDTKAELMIEDWGGFIGQWDDRQWTSKDTSHDDYGEMIGIRPGFIKRADLAWYCSHHHNAAGENVPYRYSYLFAYAIDLPAGARTITLPDNDKIRVLAISVADESPEVKPAAATLRHVSSRRRPAPMILRSTHLRKTFPFPRVEVGR